MSASKKVEIVGVGDELLLGQIEDRNGPWLCRQFARLGAAPVRLTLLPDSKEAIVSEVRRFLAGSSDILVTTGGLGLSDDEKVSSCVAAALERPFEVNDDALRMVQRRYEELAEDNLVSSTRLNESRKRMSYLPRGARPLENPLGVAPGFLFSSKQGVVAALPGRTDEMKAVFLGPLREHLAELLPGVAFSQESFKTRVKDEAVLISAMRHVRERHDVSIKSRTSRDETGLAFWIMLTASGADAEAVAKDIRAANDELREELLAGGGAEIVEEGSLSRVFDDDVPRDLPPDPQAPSLDEAAPQDLSESDLGESPRLGDTLAEE